MKRTIKKNSEKSLTMRKSSRMTGKITAKISAILAALIMIITGSNYMTSARVTSWTSRLEDFTGYGGVEYYKKSGYYVNIYGPDGTVEEVRYKAGGSRQRIYYLTDPETGEEQTAYCLASGLSFSTGAGYGADMDDAYSFSDYYDNLPESARKGIAYASIYGFSEKTMSLYEPGPVEGTLGTDFWIATQCIIWEYQQGIRTDAGLRKSNGAVEADNYYSMIKGKPAEKCYDYLLDQIGRADAIPSFAAGDESGWDNTIILPETYPGTGYYRGGVYSRTDVLTGRYYVTDENGNRLQNIQLTTSGNNFIITSSAKYENGKRLIIRREENSNEEGSAVFFGPDDPGKQTMISTGGRLAIPYAAYFSIKTQDNNGNTVKVKIEKSSGDGKVEGIPFVVAWESTNGVFYNRIIYTDENGTGETELRLGTSPGDVTQNSRSFAVMEYPSDRYNSTRTGESGNIMISRDVYFYRTYQGENIIWRFADSRDYAQFTSIDGLVYTGRYIYIGLNADVPVVLNYYNDPLKGDVKLIKRSETGAVSGFEFELSGLDPENAHIIRRSTTDQNGIATWNELLPGKYELREILEAGSIWEDPGSMIVEVEADKTTEVSVSNIRKKGSIKIIKTSDDDIFDGISFTVSDGSGIVATVEPDEDSVQLIDGRRTFVAIVGGLTPGTYMITEIVPDRYMEQPSKTVTVGSDLTAEVFFHNILELASLTVTKSIHAEEFIPAHGDATFIFRIVDTQRGKTYYRALSFGAGDKQAGQTGLISKSFSISDLQPGIYEVTELKTLRYEPESLTVDPGSSVDHDKALLNVRSGAEEAGAVFVNKVVNQEKTSGTAFCDNRFTGGEQPHT